LMVFGSFGSKGVRTWQPAGLIWAIAVRFGYDEARIKNIG